MTQKKERDIILTILKESNTGADHTQTDQELFCYLVGFRECQLSFNKWKDKNELLFKSLIATNKDFKSTFDLMNSLRFTSKLD